MTDHWWHSELRIYTIYSNYVCNNISVIIWSIITWENFLIISVVVFEKNIARRSKLAGTPQGASMSRKLFK